jgi:hypothetical protein
VINVEDFRKYFADSGLSDKQIEEILKSLYAICEAVLDDYINNNI